MKFSREPEPDVIAAPDRPRRGRRFWLLLVGLPLLVGGLALVGYVASVNSGLSAAAAEADRDDPAWRLDDLEAQRATYPDGQNAAVTIARIKQAMAKNGPDAKLHEPLSDLDPPKLLNDQQQDALKKLLDAYAPVLPLARSLRDTPRGRHVIAWAPDGISTLLACQENRDAVTMLRYDALAKAQAGDLDGAVAACHAGFHAGCSLGDEPTSISMLVRIACQAVAVNTLERVLAQGEPPPKALAELQARIEAEEPAPLLLVSARGERAMGHLFFEGLRTGKVGANVLGAVGPRGAAATAFEWMVYIPGFMAAQQSGNLRFTNRVVETAKLPPEQWTGPLAQLRAEAASLPVLARLLAPAMDRMAQACQRNHALLRCAIVALAMERHRKEKGHWAETLDELVAAGYLKAAPADPYDGGRVKLQRTADGWVIYTLGQDGVDNGGALKEQNANKAGSDVGLRLWDVAARRQPPPPPKPPDDDPAGVPGDAPPPGAADPAPPPAEPKAP